MTRTHLVILSAAILVGLWQWQLLQRFDARSSVLGTRITEAKAVLANSKKRPSGAAGTGGTTRDQPASPPLPLDVSEFFELAGEISRLQDTQTAGFDRQELRDKITALFNRLPATPVPQLKAILEKLPHSEVSADGREQITPAILNTLAESDPAAAAAYALQTKSRAGTLETVVSSWARQDAASAALWLDSVEAEGSLPRSVNREQLRLHLYPHRIAADPGGAAVDQIAQFQQSNLGDLLAETAELLTTSDQRGAFLKRLSNVPGLPPEALGHFFQEVGRASSVEVATALLKEVGPTLPPARFDELAALTATSRLDSQTPAHADWLLQNLRGPDRRPAITKLVESWTHADFNAAATWLKNQPASADYDTAVAAFAPLVADKEPPSAVDWAATIADPASRASTLQTLYRDWHAKAPEEASAYFKRKGLGAD